MTVVGAHVVLHKMVPTPGRERICAVLLYKRTQDAPIHPGHWALFGGELKENEEPAAALRRELCEELAAVNLDEAVGNTNHLTDVTISRGTGTLAVSYYQGQLDEEMDTLQLRKTETKVEGEGLGWFTQEEIQHLWLRPEDRVALSVFFRPGPRSDLAADA